MSLEARFVFKEETVYEVKLPADGKLSDNIAELRKQSGAFLTTFLASHNESTEEVDVMEEIVEDDGVAAPSAKKLAKENRRAAKRKVRPS